MTDSDSVSIAEAKSALPKLVREVESGPPVTLTRRGKPVAVLIGIDQLARLEGRRARFTAAYAELVQRFDLVALAIDPDEVFTRSRESDGGRRPAW